MKSLHIIWLCILLWGCNSGLSNNTSKFKIPETENSADIKLYEKVGDSTEIIDLSQPYSNPLPSIEDIIESIDIIPLETNEESLLGHIWQYLTTDDNIYVLDDYKIGSVAIFNRNGAFVKRITSGNGPGELAYPFKMYYDKPSMSLYIYDMIKHAILKYRSDGKYVTTYHINDAIENFYVDKSNLMLTTTKYQEGNEIFQLQKRDTLLFRILDTISLGKIKDRTSISDNIQTYYNGWNICKDNVVYRYYNNSLYRRYIFTNNIGLSFEGLYAEGKNIQHFCSIYKGRISIAYRNKSNGLMWEQKLSGSVLMGCNSIKIHDFENNVFSAILHPTYLCGKKDFPVKWNGDNMNNLIAEQDIDKLHKIKDDDNPIIVLYKIKAN